MKGWRTTSIGELVDSVQTWNPLRASPDEVFDYIDLTAVDQSTKAIVGAREVACGEAPSRARQLVATDDILVSTVRPNLNGVAKVNAEHNGATASTGFCVLRPCPNLLCSSYLFHWVKSPQFVTDMVRKATGASYPAISDRIIFESLIATPAISEQRRIAAILDQADALRVKRREALAQLDSLTQSIFTDMFGDPIQNPKGWKTCSLGDLLSKIRNGINAEQNDDENGWPISRIETIWNGSIDPTRVRYTAKNEAALADFKLDIGDILFSHINSPEHIAKTAIYEGVPSVLIHGINLLRIRGDDSIVEPIWLLHLLKHATTRTYFRARCKKAVNQASLNQQDIKALKCILPPKVAQVVFSDRIKRLTNLRAIHCSSLAELNTLFASLQYRAFRGEL